MNTAVGKKLLALVIGVLAMTLAFAPASYAGEDDGDDGGSTTKRVATSGSGSGSGDSGSASGGVAAGVGGMAVGSGQDLLVPALLTGGGILVLTAAGGIAVRRRGDLQALHGVGR